ncbi:MAG: GNAT family N-acetyltransferase [Anaerolinea sp.]|nr:GNAT family N-acetyltransferase [Anaerolinea sp.]
MNYNPLLELVEKAERIEALAAAELYSHTPPDFAAEIGVKSQWFGASLALAAHHIDWTLFNRVFPLGLDHPVTEHFIDDLCAFFAGNANPVHAFQLTPLAQPHHAADWLKARGYRHRDNWTRLVRDGSPPHVIASDLDVEIITAEQAEVFAHTMNRAFGAPEALAKWFTPLVGRPNWHHVMAFDGDHPAATAALFIDGDVGWLGFAGTLPKYRGLGAQSLLIHKRIEIGRQHGVKQFVAEVVEDTPERRNPSDHNLRRLGFQEIYKRANWAKA